MLAHAIDGGLSINILHNAARITQKGSLEAEKDLFEISNTLYKLLSIMFGAIIGVLGFIYLDKNFDLNLTETLFWLINVFLIMLYLRIVGTMTYLEGVDSTKMVIRTKLRGSIFVTLTIPILLNTDAFLFASSVIFGFIYLSFRFDKKIFKNTFYISRLTISKVLKVFFKQYSRNQIKLIISWIAGYLAFNALTLIAIARYDSDLVAEFVFLINLQTLMLGFSSIFVQPKLNVITNFILLNQLKELFLLLLQKLDF